MKCQLFRLLTITFSMVAMAVFASSALAQGNSGKGGKGGGGGGEEPPVEIGIGYRVHWPDLPPETLWVHPLNFAFATDSNGDATVALVVGYYHRNDRVGRSAFVYDHFGLIDPDSTFADSDPNSPLYDPDTDNLPIERKFWDIFELIGPGYPEGRTTPPSWVPGTHQQSAFYGVNSSGRICGTVRSGLGRDSIGCTIDLEQESLTLKELPPFYPGAVSTSAWRVNEVGDILLSGYFTSEDPSRQISVYNPDSDYLIHVRKNAAEPYFFYSVGWPEIEFNNMLEVVGTSAVGTSRGPLLTYMIQQNATDANGIGLAYTDNGGVEFDEFSRPTAINEFGQFGADALVPMRKNRVERHAARISISGIVHVQWSQKINYLAYGPYVDDINNSGDLVWQDQDNLGVSYYLHEDGDPEVSGDETFVSDFESLIIGDSDPLGVFATSDLQWVRVSDRDRSDFGWIIGNVQVGTNTDGSDRDVLAILIPEILP